MKNLRKSLSLILVLAFMVSLAAYGGQSTPAGAAEAPACPPVTLKFGYGSSASNINGLSYQYLIEQIHEKSNGSITVEFYPAGSLVGATEMLDAVMTGNVDMGHFMVADLSPMMRALTPFEIPGAYPGDRFMEWSELVHPIVDEIFQQYGLKYYASIAQDVQVILGANKVYRHPDEMQGQLIRVSGRWFSEAVRAWGGAPTTIPIQDLSTALERKMVDGVYTAWIAVLGYRLYENIHSLTLTDQQENFVGVMMNLDVWNKLTDIQKDAMQTAFEAYRPWNYDRMIAEKNVLYDVLKEHGVEVYELTDEENAAFRERNAHLMDEARAVGGEYGAKLIEIFESMR